MTESDAEFTARVIREARAKREGQDAVARAVLTNRVRAALVEADERSGVEGVPGFDAMAEAAVEVFDEFLRTPLPVGAVEAGGPEQAATSIRAVVTGIEHHLNLQPLTIQCDGCRGQWRTHHFHKWLGVEEKERLAVALRAEGWRVDGGQHFCPACA